VELELVVALELQARLLEEDGAAVDLSLQTVLARLGLVERLVSTLREKGRDLGLEGV
jgi:hypothetical protein